MKLKPLSCLLALNLIAFLSQSQTKYGNGSLKLNSDITMDWSSSPGSYIPRDSNEYKLDSKGNITWTRNLVYDAMSSKWSEEIITVEILNEFGDQLLYMDSFINPAYINDRYKFIAQYDSKGREIYDQESTWNSSKSTWIPDERANYTYNSAGDEKLEINELYNPSKGTWRNTVRRTYKTDASGNLVYNKDLWDTIANSWIPDYYIVDKVNAKKLNDTTLYKRYNNNTKTWSNQNLYVKFYDANDRVSQRVSYNWVNNSWQAFDRFTYTYTTDGQLKIYLYESMNSVTKLLQNNFRQFYIYNNKNWLIRDSTERWNNITNTWNPEFKTTHNYLSAGYEDKSVKERFFPSTSSWSNYTMTKYYYLPNLANAKRISPGPGFSVYPNPTNGLINLISSEGPFSPGSLFLYDLTGKMYTVKVDNHKTESREFQIDLSGLNAAPGTYILEYQSNDKVYRTPIILR